MNMCIFEDKEYINFFPLTLSRPVFELRTGTSSIREKICRYFSEENVFLSTRTFIEDVFKDGMESVSFDVPSGPTLFINGRVIPDESLRKAISVEDKERLFFSKKTLIAARINDTTEFLKRKEEGRLDYYESEEIIAKIVEYPWDLLSSNSDEIEKEFMLFGNSIQSQTNIVMLEKKNVFIGERTIIMPGTVIDAEDGPVIIDTGTKIMANSFLKGPLYIGKDCLIKACTRIYGPTSIGNSSKIGGEISESIFHGYSNKQHEGFIGHSYIGEWVNIGADTNNSDLKNNYKDITVYINNKPVETGLTSVGTFIGDHTKTAISTAINTGTVIGFSCNIFGEGFPSKYVPSFSWGGRRRVSVYKLEDAIETAKIVMKRRNVTMLEPYRKMIQTIFNETVRERNYGT